MKFLMQHNKLPEYLKMQENLQLPWILPGELTALPPIPLLVGRE